MLLQTIGDSFRIEAIPPGLQSGSIATAGAAGERASAAYVAAIFRWARLNCAKAETRSLLKHCYQLPARPQSFPRLPQLPCLLR